MSSKTSSTESALSSSAALTIQCAVRCWRARKTLDSRKEERRPTSLLQENLFRSLHRRFLPRDIVSMIRGDPNFMSNLPMSLKNTMGKAFGERGWSYMPTFFDTYSMETVCHSIQTFFTVLNNDDLFPRLIEFRNLARICSEWNKTYTTVVLKDRIYTHRHCLVEDVATALRPNATQMQERSSWIHRFMREAGKALFLEDVFEMDFKKRPNRVLRKQHLRYSIGGRRFNKLCRFLLSVRSRMEKIRTADEFQLLAMHAKSSLPSYLQREDFGTDDVSLMCVAYTLSNMNRRSEFIAAPQKSAYDELVDDIVHLLLERQDVTKWYAVSHVLLTKEVLAQLSDEEKGRLLGTAHHMLHEFAMRMDVEWKKLTPNRKTMIVERGMNSLTWNLLAGAWNKARNVFYSMYYWLGLEPSIWFGKAMRLMAADVAMMHAMYGGGLHPDTRVAAALPLPWEVFIGKDSCAKEDIVAACAELGVEAHPSWIYAPSDVVVAPITPTPELLHGVQIASPELAKLLKSMGAFSGKK